MRMAALPTRIAIYIDIDIFDSKFHLGDVGITMQLKLISVLKNLNTAEVTKNSSKAKYNIK